MVVTHLNAWGGKLYRPQLQIHTPTEITLFVFWTGTVEVMNIVFYVHVYPEFVKTVRNLLFRDGITSNIINI